MRVHIDTQLRHHAAERSGLRDRAIVQVKHRRDALQHQAGLVLGRHGIEQEAQCGSDILAIDAAIFLIGDTAAVVDGAEQHQSWRTLAGLHP